MTTLAESVYLDSAFGVETPLPKAGSALENPYVYDDAARELKLMEQRGLIRVSREHAVLAAGQPLIDRLSFIRLR